MSQVALPPGLVTSFQETDVASTWVNGDGSVNKLPPLQKSEAAPSGTDDVAASLLEGHDGVLGKSFHAPASTRRVESPQLQAMLALSNQATEVGDVPVGTPVESLQKSEFGEKPDADEQEDTGEEGEEDQDDAEEEEGGEEEGTEKSLRLTESLNDIDALIKASTPVGGMTPGGYKKVAEGQYVKPEGGSAGKHGGHPTATHEFTAVASEFRKYRKISPAKAVPAAKKLIELISSPEFSHYKADKPDLAAFVQKHGKIKPGERKTSDPGTGAKPGSKEAFQQMHGGKGGLIEKLNTKESHEAEYGKMPQSSSPHSQGHMSDMVDYQARVMAGEKEKKAKAARSKVSDTISSKQSGDTMSAGSATYTKGSDGRWKSPSRNRSLSDSQLTDVVFTSHMDKSMTAIEILEDYLSKSSSGLPSGDHTKMIKTKSGEIGGSADGGSMESSPKGGTSPSSDMSGDGYNADGYPAAPGCKSDKLSEDDDPVERQMTDTGAKPLESTRKSFTPAAQREMVAHEHAQKVSRLRKGEPDVRLSADDMAADLVKSDTFYYGAAPSFGTPSIDLTSSRRCLSCEGTFSKSLTACPDCGVGQVRHQVLPVHVESGDRQPMLRKSRHLATQDVFLGAPKPLSVVSTSGQQWVDFNQE